MEIRNCNRINANKKVNYLNSEIRIAFRDNLLYLVLYFIQIEFPNN